MSPQCSIDPPEPEVILYSVLEMTASHCSIFDKTGGNGRRQQEDGVFGVGVAAPRGPLIRAAMRRVAVCGISLQRRHRAAEPIILSASPVSTSHCQQELIIRHLYTCAYTFLEPPPPPVLMFICMLVPTQGHVSGVCVSATA